MRSIVEQFKQLLFTGTFVMLIMPAIAQVHHLRKAIPKRAVISPQLKEFYRAAADADVNFIFPRGFQEITAPDNEDFSFDYAMKLPGKEFEIWCLVKPEKQNWASYERMRNTGNTQMPNPDSSYREMAAAQAISFTGEKNFSVVNLPPDILARYNASEGKSYLLTLLNLPVTKSYKYALLITLHKDHTGTIMAVCFTNDKGPEFFKNINLAGKCLKFKS
jgi:hypothetical protein